MKLRCEHLGHRIAAVGLELVPLMGIDARPEWGAVSAALHGFAGRVESRAELVPLGLPYTAFHGWGVQAGDPLPADTIRVYVGPAVGDVYGVAAPGGWQAERPLARSWGGWVGLNLDAIASDGADVATVARHEFGHVIGLDHSTPPKSLMHPHTSPGIVKDITAGDADALEAAGWDAAPLTAFPDRDYVRVYGIGTTPNGWAYMTLDDAERAYPNHVRGADSLGDSWALYPAGG